MLRGLIFGAVSSLALLTAAGAADLGTPGGYKDDYVPAASWTGFYVGANAGFSNNQSSIAYVPPGPPFTGVASAYSAIGSGSVSSTEFAGGGQIGYNRQIGAIVLGAEADIDASSHSASFSQTGTPLANVTLTSNATVSTDWLATVRARVGIPLGSALFYVTGGAAATDLKFSQSNTYAALGTEHFSTSQTKWGATWGGGVEYALNPHWSIKGEFLHVDFGHVSGLSPFPVCGGCTSPHSHSATLETDTARVGVNYHILPAYEPLK